MGHSIQIENYEYDDGIVSLDITYNLSEMYYLAIKNAGWGDKVKRLGAFLDGKKLKDVRQFLIDIRNELESNPLLYKKYNPSNGWGSYDGLLKNINKLIVISNEVPDNKINNFY